MKKNAYYLSIGIALYSLSFLATSTEVKAETATSSNPEAIPPPNTRSIETTERQQAIQEAQKAGIAVVEFGYKQAPSKEIAEKEINAQTEYIQTTTEEYIAASKAYQAEFPRYQQYTKELEKFHEDSLAYAQYEKQERQYQSELAHYQEQESNYQKEVEKYEEDHASNLLLQAEFESQQKQYEQDQASYQERLAHYEATKKEAAEALADYQRKLESYQIEKIRYDKAKQAYDTEVAQAEKMTKTDGYLSQVSAQYLISRSEPNATVTFKGVDKFIAPSHHFGNGLSGIGSKASELPLTNTPTLFRGVGAATAAKAGDGYGLILEKGKPITVIYSGLEQTSYDGQKIAQLVYTYELTSTFASDNSASTFIYTDPTKTIYTGSSGQNKGLVDFNIHQTISYYLENGEKVHFRENAPALLSFASRNNTFEFGEQEYVRLGKGMTFIPISGSSVTGENGYVASRISNNTTKDGSRFERGDWDNDGHPNEYYGAGVAQVIGDTISFDFGIRYSQANIQRSSNPLHLRQSSRQWFSVNADIKAKGIINSRPGNPPVVPHKPILPALPPKPVAPLKPTKPSYRVLTKPTPPVKPVRKHIVISRKPTRPKEVKHPQLPQPPVIFIPRIVYPTINIQYSTRYKNPTRQTRQAPPANSISAPNNSTISTRSYSIPVQVGQETPAIRYPALAPVAPARQDVPSTPTPSLPSPARRTIKKNPIPHGSPAIMEREAKDAWFSENTGIYGKDKELFFQFIDELEKEARVKYGNDLAKINQHIANGIAYWSYGISGLQPKVADVGEEPQNSLARNLMERIHKLDEFKIDFPHLAAPIATAAQSSLKKEVLKTVLGLNFGMALGVSPSDVFFQANSWLGDTMTNMNDKDKITDKDAFILHSRIYATMPLNEAIKRYYSIPNLDKKREDLYQLALRVNYPTSPDPEFILKASAFLSISTIGLIVVFGIIDPLREKWKELKSGWNDFKGKMKEYWDNFISFFSKGKGQPIAPTHKADKLPSLSLTSSQPRQAKMAKPFSKIAATFKPKNILAPLKQTITPVAKFLQKKVVQPAKKGIKKIGNIIQKKIISPIKQAVKPIARSFQKRIVKPAKTFIKKAGKTVQKKIIQPIKQGMRPITKAFQKKIVKPAKKGLQKVGKVIQPLKRATKPARKVIKKRVLQPAKRIAKRVAAPIQRKVIRPVKQAGKPIVKKVQRKIARPIQKASKKTARKPAKKKGR